VRVLLDRTGGEIGRLVERKRVLAPVEALAWSGRIDGRHVACMPPEWLVRWHTGYALDADDLADVTALCTQFGIPLPGEYVALRESAAGLPEA